MVIVTKNQYLLASKIHHITLDEVVNWVDARNNQGRLISVRDAHYVIQIIYAPENVSTNNGSMSRQEEYKECSVTIRTAASAHKVFQDLIQQIREQMPDQLYLDTALERMLAAVDVSKLIAVDEKDEMEKTLQSVGIKPVRDKYDRSTKKVRKSRKAKRGSKALLRKSK